MKTLSNNNGFALVATLTSANAASFIAYNDFFGNTGAASPNTTAYGNGSSGAQKDIATGAPVDATLTVSGTTGFLANNAGAPASRADHRDPESNHAALLKRGSRIIESRTPGGTRRSG